MGTILIIEDNLDIRESTCELLELLGYQVLLADSGARGLLLAKGKLPDIILCDILMPLMDGYQVLKKLKKNLRTACIPVIFLTAIVGKKEVSRGLELGASAYLVKPFSEKELLDCITLSAPQT